MDVIAVPFEIKFAKDAEPGEFEGYGAVFGNMDGVGDMIMPGAFTKTLADLKAAGSTPAMYMQHGWLLGADPRPVGKWLAMSEDTKGLAVKGKLVGLDTETGRYNHALVKEGAMTGLSIGFRAVRAEHGSKAGDPRRKIHELKLREVSIVDDPMNALARISAVKGASITERDFERWLTQDAGYSRSEARVIINQGFKSLKAMQDAGSDGLDELAGALRSNAAILRT